MQCVNRIKTSRWVCALVLTAFVSGCSSVDIAQIREMIGLSKRVYSTKGEPTTTNSPAPVVITPPASSNSNANVPDFISYRIAAAKKIMAANPSGIYGGAVPDPLASIPVLEISLNSDGSIAALDVMRRPHFYPETIELAKAAVRRAAPFGSVAHLPRPWTFNETFLFNDDLKFQLHALQP